MPISLPYTVKFLMKKNPQFYVFTFIPSTLPKTQLKPINIALKLERKTKQKNICLA